MSLFNRSLRFLLPICILLVGITAPVSAQACPLGVNTSTAEVTAEAPASATLEAAPDATLEAASTFEVNMTPSGEGPSGPPPATSAPAETTEATAEAETEAPIIFLAFAHAAPDTGPIDIYVDSTLGDPAVEGLAFGQATDLMPFEGLSHGFLACATEGGNNGEPLIVVQRDFNANSSWVVTAVGLQETASFFIEPVSAIRNEYNGQARVRVVNFVPDATVDVVNDTGIDFGTGLGWLGIKDVMLDEGSYNLQVNSNGETLVEPAAFDVVPNTTTLLYVIGRPGIDAGVQLVPIVVPQETARVRFVNMRPDTIDIHYRPSEARIVENLAPGATSDWVTLEAGAVTFLAYAPGTGPTGTELSGIADQLRPARDYTINVGESEMTIAEAVMTPDE